MKPIATLSHPLPSTPEGTPSPAASAWRFTVHCPTAEQVMLVTEEPSGLSSWVPMVASTDHAGAWQLDITQDGVVGAVRYYTIEDGAVLNCGTAGRSAKRVKTSPTPPLAATA